MYIIIIAMLSTIKQELKTIYGFYICKHVHVYYDYGKDVYTGQSYS